MSTLRDLALVITAFGVCAAPSPQQTHEQPTVLSIHTDLVTLPVTVVDRKGAFVTGLSQHHFTIYDNDESRPIQFFTNEDAPATIGLVIDSSGSMRGRREQIASAVTAFAAMSHPLDEFFTLNFNDRVWLGLPPSETFTADRTLLLAAISALPTEGMSALYDGLDRALDQLALGTHDRKALIVLSDGGDNASAQTLEGVIEHARRSSAAVYAVTLFDQDNHDARPRVLRKLARETGGDAFTPRRTSDVMDSFTQIARELRSVYTIGFVPPDTAESGFRSIRVVADAGDGRQLIARTRAGYYARP
ncbi:MAG TPA: VWA domain-containing protein [Vicinamibacterales bacterium]